jgi:hypothetical protein
VYGFVLVYRWRTCQVRGIEIISDIFTDLLTFAHRVDDVKYLQDLTHMIGLQQRLAD